LEIAKLLAEPHRRWVGRPPAPAGAIKTLEEAWPIALPAQYAALLRAFNGGEGPLALPPQWFVLYDAEFAADLNRSPELSNLYPGYIAIGSNGGLETIAFDARVLTALPVVMYDPVAGVESAVVIASDIATFIQAIGLECNP
jgi:hypothetical protein